MNQDRVLETLAEERQQQKVVNLDVQPPSLIGPQPGTIHKTANTPFDFAAKRIAQSRAATSSISPTPGSMASRPGRAGNPSTAASPAPLRRLTSVREPQPGDSGSSGEGLTTPRHEASMDEDYSWEDFLSEDVPGPQPAAQTEVSDDVPEMTMEELLDD